MLPAVVCYIVEMSPTISKILQQVAGWPEEDQQELAEAARDIEARRRGTYVATADELQAVDEAERGGLANNDAVEAALRSFRAK